MLVQRTGGESIGRFVMSVKVVWLLLSVFVFGCVTQGTNTSENEHDTARWENVDRIVAAGDIHGDYDQFVRALRAADVIDNTHSWAAGETHFVQLGDIFDRGPDS